MDDFKIGRWIRTPQKGYPSRIGVIEEIGEGGELHVRFSRTRYTLPEMESRTHPIDGRYCAVICSQKVKT